MPELLTKTCTACGEEFNRSEFYKKSGAKDGLQRNCKACEKKYKAEYRRTHKAEILQYKHDYYHSHKEQEAKAHAEYARKNREHLRKYAVERYRRPHVREATLIAIKKYRIENPIKEKARRMVRVAVQNGSLIRPIQCSVCGEAGKIQAHHEDYSKPLDVQWVCTRCHGQITKRRKQEKSCAQPIQIAANPASTSSTASSE